MPLQEEGDATLEFDIYLDASSVEIFVNKGERAMTAQVFPTTPYTHFTVSNKESDPVAIEKLKIYSIDGIWEVP